MSEGEVEGGPMLSGSCLCAVVAYEASVAESVTAWFCHCGHCRKAGGGAFATWVAVAADGFRWSEGVEHAASYASSAGFLRHFCGLCGGLLPALDCARGRVLLPAGGLADGPPVAPACHTFVSSRARWDHIHDSLPCFAGDVGDRSVATATAAAVPSSVGQATGSCLCGDVVWEMEGEPQVMRCCHCTRCQHKSGTAYFVGLPGKTAQLRFIQGEDCLASFHLPGTRYYRNCFCRRCGSPAPASLPGIPVTVASAGTLDSDPGVHIGYHLFARSRVSWCAIDESLPAFDTYPPKGFVPDS
jgi:hypothetical protein